MINIYIALFIDIEVNDLSLERSLIYFVISYVLSINLHVLHLFYDVDKFKLR